MAKILLDIILKPAWKWIVAIPFEALAAVQFFFPDWEQYLNFPALSSRLAWYWWAIIGLVLFIFISSISSASEISKLRKAGSAKPVGKETNVKPQKPNLEGVRLAEGAFITYPDHDYYNVTIEEYVFTFTNESGQDLKRCFVLLDELASRPTQKPDDDWKVIAKNVFAKPFRWSGSVIYIDGKRDIDANDKANLTVISSTLSPVLNVTKNESEYHYDFRFTFFEDEGYSLDYGYDYRLLLGFRAKDETGSNIVPIRYYLYLRVRPVSPGVDLLGIKRLNTNTKAAEHRLQRTGFLLRVKKVAIKLFTRRKKKSRKSARRCR